MPADWVEGVLAPEEDGEGAAAVAATPYSAPRRPQRTYETPQAGGCLCGAVRFAVNAGREPRLVVACHCRFCQKASGGPFLCWATIDAEDYTILQARAPARDRGPRLRHSAAAPLRRAARANPQPPHARAASCARNAASTRCWLHGAHGTRYAHASCFCAMLTRSFLIVRA